MNSVMKRNLFLVLIVFLVAALLIIGAVVLSRGPRVSPVEKIEDGEAGTIVVDDVNDGKMTIPYYDIPTSDYRYELFTEKNGVVTYENGKSAVGVTVNMKCGDIDWVKVKESGVDFAMIRVGHRAFGRGDIYPDEKFEENIKGASDAGLDVGVYFFSQAITEAEAEEEATFVLERIQGYQVTYPIAFDWEYARNKEGNLAEDARTKNCTGEQITQFANTFCKKISRAGYTASFFAEKAMGYETLDLSQLSGYDMWYSEYRKVPSFYYRFKIWQYTNEGEVPGISVKVPVNIALESYVS